VSTIPGEAYDWTPGHPGEGVLPFTEQTKTQLLVYAESVADAWFHPELECNAWWDGVSPYMATDWAIQVGNFCSQNPVRTMNQIYDSKRIAAASFIDHFDGVMARVQITGETYVYRLTFARSRLEDPWLMTYFTLIARTAK
jgi:hypothetical protein